MEKRCPVCKGSKKIVIIEREMPPYCNRLFERKEDAKQIPMARMELCLCTHCGFVYNAKFEDGMDLYSEGYNNSQFSSGVFEEYIDACIELLCSAAGAGENAVFLEVGCGLHGDFLKKLVARYPGACRGIGYDPAYCGEELVWVKENGSCKFIRKYFDGSEEGSAADLVLSRHCIEHMSDPWITFDMLGKAVEGGMAYVETPDVRWSLKNMKWFDFGYEHCSLFSPAPFRWMAQKKGLHIQEIRYVFGEQYMQVLLGKNGCADRPAERGFAGEIEEMELLADNYRRKEREILSGFRRRLREYRAQGTVAIWGAGGKGNVFLNLLDPAEEYVDAVIDINPSKAGKFIAGTGHAILPPEKIGERGIKTILIMNANYRKEIGQLLHRMHLEGVNLCEM